MSRAKKKRKKRMINRMINREEANVVLFELINSEILDAELKDSVQEIATCINYEEKGLHLWGADDDCTELMVAKRQDLWTLEEIAKCEAISKKYKFTPSPFEREENE